jgi:hypothetical protein
MQFVWREDYPHEQLVNRSDGVVRMVFVGGRLAWDGHAFVDEMGSVRFGRALRHRDWYPADRAAAGAGGEVAAGPTD